MTTQTIERRAFNSKEVTQFFTDSQITVRRNAKRERASSTKPDPLAAAYATLHLLPTAPRELTQAAYRIAALAHHPDREGGNHDAMVRINGAADLLRARGAL